MIAAIVPQFFTSDLATTLRYYQDKLGFETQFTYGKPAFYAGTIRDGFSIFFRCVNVSLPQSQEKYTEEFLDAYIRVERIDELFAEYQSRGVIFAREIASMPWA